MRSLVWGAGAIGGTLGAYLARAGHDVTLVDTVAEHVDAITRGGLRIAGPIDEFTVRVPAYTPQTLTGTWDQVILATKAHHTEAAVRALGPHLAAGGCVWLVGALVAELGGGRFAQLLAGACVGLAPVLSALFSYLSMNAFDALASRMS